MRSFKFYRKNEAEVMESLGMKPTKNSGSGWIEKEDGQNGYVICQLKSTDAQSIKVNQKDIRMLESNALVAHKIPVFAIQYLNTGEVWLMIKPEQLQDVAQYLNTGSAPKLEPATELEDLKPIIPVKVESSERARKTFFEQKQKEYEKRGGRKRK